MPNSKTEISGSSLLVALLIEEGRIIIVDPTDGSTRELTDNAGAAPDGVVVLPNTTSEKTDVRNLPGTVYWTTMGQPTSPTTHGEEPGFNTRNGGINAIEIDGSARREVVAAGGITTGKQLATDGRRLYWGDREGLRVSICNTDGSDLRDLVINEDFGDGTSECVGVAVDVANQSLYWSQKGPAKAGKGRIFRAHLGIPLGQTVENRNDVEILWENLPEPIDLHVCGSWLYWTDRGSGPKGNTLNRAPIPPAGEKGAEPEILARGFREAIGLAVDVDTTFSSRGGRGVAYVSDLSGDIRVIPINNGDVTERTISLGTPVTGLALVRT